LRAGLAAPPPPPPGATRCQPSVRRRAAARSCVARTSRTLPWRPHIRRRRSRWRRVRYRAPLPGWREGRAAVGCDAARKAHALRRCTTTADRRHAAGAGGRSRRRRRSSPAAAGGTGRNGTAPAHTARRSSPRPRRGCRRTDAVHPRPAGRAHRFAGPCAPPCRRTAATRRGRIGAPARAR